MSIPVEVRLDRAWGGAAEVEENEGKAWARGIGEGCGRGWPERAAEQLGTVSGMSADEQSTCGWKNREGRTHEQGEMEVRRERRAGLDLLVDWEHGEASCDWRRGAREGSRR